MLRIKGTNKKPGVGLRCGVVEEVGLGSDEIGGDGEDDEGIEEVGGCVVVVVTVTITV